MENIFHALQTDKHCKIHFISPLATSQLGESQILLDLGLHGGDGVVPRPQPGHGPPLLVDDELGEVPLDGVDQEARLLLLQEGPQGRGAAAIYIYLGKHVELKWKLP